MYAPSNKASKHTKQKLTRLKGEMDKSTFITGKAESEREKYSVRETKTQRKERDRETDTETKSPSEGEGCDLIVRG